MAFEFVFTTEEIREKMYNFLRTLRFGEDFSYGTEWATGIFDKENNVFMTLVYFESSLGHDCDDFKCIVIVNNSDIFLAHLYGWAEKDQFTIPEEYENLREIVKEGLIYYEDFCDYDDYTDLPDEKQKEVDEINEMMTDRFKLEVAINSEDDARKLFESCDFNYNTVFYEYNKKTFEVFDQYASEEKMLAWRGAEYKRRIEECIIQKNFSDKGWRISYLLYRGVDVTHDELYYKLIEENVGQPDFNYLEVSNYIGMYMGKYPEKVNNLIPLLDMLDAHINGMPDINILKLKEEIEKARKLIDKE